MAFLAHGDCVSVVEPVVAYVMADDSDRRGAEDAGLMLHGLEPVLALAVDFRDSRIHSKNPPIQSIQGPTIAAIIAV